MTDMDFMQAALNLAREAGAEGEVPVGAVVVRNGEIVGMGRNRRELDKNALAHAEIEAIEAACRTLNGWRLWECELYVTLEPCPMCAGAIVLARIPLVVWGLSDPKRGGHSVFSILNHEGLNHRPEILAGVMETECREMFQAFFKEKRGLKE